MNITQAKIALTSLVRGNGEAENALMWLVAQALDHQGCKDKERKETERRVYRSSRASCCGKHQSDCFCWEGP